MKKVECLIRAEQLSQIRTSLADLGVPRMTITEHKGWRPRSSKPHPRPARASSAGMVPEMKVEIEVPEEMARHVVKMFFFATLRQGIKEGKQTVLSLGDVIRIGTAEPRRQAV